MTGVGFDLRYSELDVEPFREPVIELELFSESTRSLVKPGDGSAEQVLTDDVWLAVDSRREIG